MSNSKEESKCNPEEAGDLLVKKHVQFFKRVMNVIPPSAIAMDTNRMPVLFFCLSGLDLLSALDTALTGDDKENIIEWIYAQQILPTTGDPDDLRRCGFRGSTGLGIPYEPDKASEPHPFDSSHVTMVYTALSCLLILGDDLSRVNRKAVLAGVRNLQLENGCFRCTTGGGESDMRFVYSASAVCYILQDWSGMDTDKAVEYIKMSQNYDYGVGQGPHLESHGGSTFCAVAALVLMGRLESTFSPAEIEGLKKWCVRRQQTGFQGRPNKPVDTCYSFWVGATLNMLGCSSLVNKEWNRSFVLSTQGNIVGGFSKWPDSHPDPLHTYLGLCGLSLNGEPDIAPVHAPLNITQRAMDWLRQVQSRHKV